VLCAVVIVNVFLRELIAERSVSELDTDETEISIIKNGSVVEVIVGAQVQFDISLSRVIDPGGLSSVFLL
jgi:hypothetical protein